MLRYFLVVIGISLASNAHAECKKWEYARLKDADKAELSNLYCASVSQATLAHKAAKGRLEIGLHARAADKMEIEQVCMEQVEEAERMLKKKFKSKPPVKCAARYKSEVLDDGYDVANPG